MEWPLSKPNLNPIENLWSIVKIKLFCKTDLWEVIKTTMSEIKPTEVKEINEIHG